MQQLYKLLVLFVLGCQTLSGQKTIQPTTFFTSNTSQAKAANGCNIVVNAGPDITICAGIPKNLQGMASGGYSSLTWEPPDGLSNTKIVNPLANPATTTTYTLTAMGTSGNLITNGGFETGVINPATTNYTQYNNVNALIGSTGGYMIMSVPQIAQAFGCNPAIGNFTLVITPTGSGQNIWCQTIPTSKNTDYKIEFKVFGILYIFGPAPSIGLSINGTLIGNVDAISGLCIESDGSFIWNSGNATSANICLASYSGSGPASMCAIDDITVKECCVEKDEVTVTVYDLIADVAKPDDINCNNRPLTLDASASTSGPLIKYEWTTTNGKILSGDKTTNPVIDDPGTYTFKIIGEYGCEKTVTVVVNGSVKPPDLQLKNTDLTCVLDRATIEAKSKSSNPMFDWSGPNSYTSTRSTDLNIKEPGDYIVTVTDDYGCKTTGKVTVKDLRTDVDIQIIGDTIRCGEDSVFLVGKSISPAPFFVWKSSGGKKTNANVIFAKDTGWYVLTVQDSLGCSTMDSFYLINFKTNVPIGFISDTLDCVNPIVTIKLITDTSGTALWRGPNGFVSTQKQVSVTDSGWYYVNIQTSGGCNGLDSVYVPRSAELPDAFIMPTDTITCLKSTITLQGGSNTMGSSIQWQGPGGGLGNTNQIMVSDSGDYTLFVTGSNGCLASAQIHVYKDIDTPKLNLVSDTLNCIVKSIALNPTGNPNLNYQWSGPNAFNSTLSNPIITEAGEYIVVVIGKNGCPKSGFLLIEQDTLPPNIDVLPDTINCNKPSLTPKTITDLDIINYSWTGPNQFNSNSANPVLNQGGQYSVTVRNSSGCESTKSFTIFEDILKPTVSISSDTISCKQAGQIKIEAIDPQASFTWTGPNGFNSIQQQNPISTPGWYIIQVTGINGCITLDSVFVFQKDILPNVFTSNDTLTCSRTSLNLKGGSSTQNVIFEWKGPNGFMSNQMNPIVSDSGLYTLKVIDPNGCEAISQLMITKLGINPTISLALLDSLTCKTNTATLEVTDNQNSKMIQWSGPNNFNSSNSKIIIQESGTYYIKVTNEFGCESVDSITVQDFRKLPVIQINDEKLDCSRRNAFVNLITQDLGLQFNWSGPNGFSSNLKNPAISDPGTYSVTVTNNLNCALIKQIIVTKDTLVPDIFLSADTITCTRKSVPIKAFTTTQGFNLIWKGPNGFMSGSPQIPVTSKGYYVCTIINPRNKCFIIDSVLVLEDTALIRNAVINNQDASCNQDNGSIIIGSIDGGAAPYQYSIDKGSTFQSGSLFNGLKSGIYDVKILDRNGCTFDQQIKIDVGSGVDVELESQIEIQANDNKQLNLVIKNIAQTDVDKILWSPSDQLSCSDCPNPILTATHDDVITVIVTDKNGCSSEASIRIIVKRDFTIYLPTIFSPNHDETNDSFYPTSSIGSVTVDRMTILDRWGNVVFDRKNFLSDQAALGWLGTYQNKPVNPGVYVYLIEVNISGTVKKIYGDITLIR